MEQLETKRRQKSKLRFQFDEQPEHHLSERIAHRLRNPLTTIMSCCSQLRASNETKFSESDRKFLDWIAEAAEQQEESIRRFVRAYGPLNVTPRECDLGQAVLRLSRLEKPGAQTRLLVTLPRQELKVVADYDLVHEVLDELFRNAIEAESSEIEISAGVTAETVWVRIANTPTKQRTDWRSRYGEPFFTSKPGHAGLGVVIARRLMEIMGGEINLEKTDDQVAVTLSLPRADTRDHTSRKGLWYAEDSHS